MPKTFVTGATGFIGNAIVQRLLCQDEPRHISVAVRRDSLNFSDKVQQHIVNNLEKANDWSNALREISVVVHCAARVHLIVDSSIRPLDEFRAANVHGTINLAKQAVVAGVQRFVFISSIGVNGAETFQQPFTEIDQAHPHSPYAVSKYEAEMELQDLAAKSGMEVVIIRPPLVYGPNAPGNFGSLMRWLQRGIPLPLGAIHNQRSLVALDNLVDLILTCLTHPAAANKTFLVSDDEDVSTTELLRRMGQAMNRPARLIPVPAFLLEQAAGLVGKRDMAQRLCGSLQVDIQKTRQLLGWNPPLTLDQGLKRAAEGMGA